MAKYGSAINSRLITLNRFLKVVTFFGVLIIIANIVSTVITYLKSLDLLGDINVDNFASLWSPIIGNIIILVGLLTFYHIFKTIIELFVLLRDETTEIYNTMYRDIHDAQLTVQQNEEEIRKRIEEHKERLKILEESKLNEQKEDKRENIEQEENAIKQQLERDLAKLAWEAEQRRQEKKAKKE